MTTLAFVSLIVITAGLLFGSTALDTAKKLFGLAAVTKNATCIYGAAGRAPITVSGEPFSCDTVYGKITISSIFFTEAADGSVTYTISGNFKNGNSFNQGLSFVVDSRNPEGGLFKYSPHKYVSSTGSRSQEHLLFPTNTVPIDGSITTKPIWAQELCQSGKVTANIMVLKNGASLGEVAIDLNQYPPLACQPTNTPTPEPTVGPEPSETPVPTRQTHPIPTLSPTPPAPTFFIPTVPPNLTPTPTPETSACPFNTTSFLKDTQCNPVTTFNDSVCKYGTANDQFLAGVAVMSEKDACYNNNEKKAGLPWVARPRSTFGDKCASSDAYSDIYDSNSCKAEHQVRVADLNINLSYRENQTCCVNLGDSVDPGTNQRVEHPDYTYRVGVDRAGVKAFLASTPGGVIRDSAGVGWTIERQECFGDGCPEVNSINVIPGSANKSQVDGLSISCDAKYRYGWILRKEGDTRLAKSSCSCGFKAVNYVKDADTGEYLTAFDNNISYGTSNNKKYQKGGAEDSPDANFKDGKYCRRNVRNNFAEACKTEVKTGSYEFAPKGEYGQGEVALIKLYYDEDNWDIVGQECTGVGCPQELDNTNIIKGIDVNCGTDVKYGWLLRRKSTQITPPPPPPGSCKFKANNFVRVVDLEGNDISSSYPEINRNPDWGTANNKAIARAANDPNIKLPTANFDDFQHCTLKADGLWENCTKVVTMDLPETGNATTYGRGDSASIRLYKPEDSGPNGFTIIRKECYYAGEISPCPGEDILQSEPMDMLRDITLNCGADIEYGWVLVPNSLINDTPTPTPTPSGPGVTAILNMKLQFQGITKEQIANGNVTKDTLNVRVGIAGGSFLAPVYKFVDFKMGPDAIWTGQVSFDQVVPNQGHKILIKGPMHLQRKVCDLNPTEEIPNWLDTLQTYRYVCDQGNLFLTAGEQDLDFSNIIQLAGDVPLDFSQEASPEGMIGFAQDGVVNSFDIAYVDSNFFSSVEDVLKRADFNLDGEVTTGDHDLLIGTLSVQSDER